MNAVRFTQLSLFLCIFALLAGCGLNTGRPLEKGEGDGHQWAPESDGKFLVIDVDNQFTSDIEFVCHGRPGIFRMFVDAGKHQFMVLKDADYTMELRTRKTDAGKAEFLELEERLLGVRRIHMRAIVKGSANQDNALKRASEAAR